MNRHTRQFNVLLVTLLTGCLGACGGGTETGTVTTPSTTESNDFSLVPDSLDLTAPGASGQLVADLQTANPNVTPSQFAFKTADSTIATVSAPTGSNGGVANATVTAVGAGETTVSVTFSRGDAQNSKTATVIVWPGGTWTGSLDLVGSGNCPGSLDAYGETVVISVNASGVGTLTATGTFNRPYAISIPSSVPFQFSSSGTFPFGTQQVPGSMSVTSTGPKTLDYKETTSYLNLKCSNTYRGTLNLTRQ